MKKIIIITSDKYIYSNIEEYLHNYFNMETMWLQEITEANITTITKEDFVIALYNEKDLQKYTLLQSKELIIFSPEEVKEVNLKNSSVLLFPIYLPELLNYIKVFANENNNRTILNIPNYELLLDYGDAWLKNKKLDKTINITATEGNILKKLFINHPNYIEKKDLSTNKYIYSHSLDTHIFNIRKKLSTEKFELEILRNKEQYKLLIK